MQGFQTADGKFKSKSIRNNDSGSRNGKLSRRAHRRPGRAAVQASMVEALEGRLLLSTTTPLSYGPNTYTLVPGVLTSANASSQNASPTQPNHLVIIPKFDVTITSDPNAAAIEAAINTAIANFEFDISTPITVNITFDAINSGLAQSNKFIDQVTYTAFRNALIAHATSPEDTAGINKFVPAGTDNPVNGNANVELTYSNARALGFSATPPGGTDGTIGFNMSLFNLDRYNINPNDYDLVSAASHEIDEVLAIGSALNSASNGAPPPTGPIFPEDLFRVASDGTTRSFNTDANAAAYFSVNGVLLEQFNQAHDPSGTSGDYNDWYSVNGGQIPQVQDAFGTPGSTPDLGVELNVLDVLGYTRATGVQGGFLPDLLPFRLEAWSSPLVVTTSASSTTEATTITTTDSVFLDAAFINFGEEATQAACTVTIVLDGSVKFTFTDPAGIAVGTREFSTGLSLGKLSAGPHTVTMNIDTKNTVNEIIESNNTISTNFTVTAPAQPDLAPYQPTGWSAPIVLSSVKGTNTDAAIITTDDTLYVDAAVINQGTGATAVTFSNELLLDGKVVFTFTSAPPLDADFYSYYLDASLGKLTAGSHTIELIADSGNAIAESNETNNTLTRTFTVSAPHLVFHVQPASEVAGKAIAPSVVVDIENSLNQIITADESSVTISKNAGLGALTGTVTIAAVNGVATFSNLIFTTAGTGYKIQAKDGVDTAAISNAFNVTAAAFAHLAFVQNPTNVVAGVNDAPAITVKATDAFGNVITGASVTLKIGTGPVGGAIIGTVTATTNASGIATFSGISFHIAGSYTLTASDGAIVSPKSTAFTVAHAALAHLAFVQNPTNVVAGVNDAPAITVKATDAFGNVISGASVTLKIGTGPVGGAIIGTAVATTNASGIATFSGISFHIAGSYTLTASDGVIVSPKSTAFTVSAAKASKLVFTTMPVGAKHGVAFTVKVSVEDAFGNVLIADNSGTITLALATHPTGSTLAGTLTATVTKGVATFSTLKVSAAGSYSLKASDSFALAAVTSPTFVVT